MRKFVRMALIVFSVLAFVPVTLFTLLWGWMWYASIDVERFYRENRLLGEMRAAERNSTNHSVPAREALLRMVPLGTNKETVISVLGKEKLGCQSTAGPINCQSMSP